MVKGRMGVGGEVSILLIHTGAIVTDQYSGGNWTVYLTDVSCIGNETAITHCQHLQETTTCTNTARVMCVFRKYFPPKKVYAFKN